MPSWHFVQVDAPGTQLGELSATFITGSAAYLYGIV